MTRPATLGFDRKILLAWLDTAVVAVQEVGSGAKLKGHLVRQLAGQCLGVEARDKTATVLAHIWGTVPIAARPLRDEGLRLWAEVDPAERVALHWGMALVTYPFFRDITDVCGRLCQLQPAITLGQVERRVVERWGDRSTVRRAVQRVIRSLHAWGLLAEGSIRGAYTLAPAVSLRREVSEWLLAACLGARPGGRMLVALLLEHPTLFPFGLRMTSADLQRIPRFEVEREGLDTEMIVLRETPKAALAAPTRAHVQRVRVQRAPVIHHLG